MYTNNGIIANNGSPDTRVFVTPRLRLTLAAAQGPQFRVYHQQRDRQTRLKESPWGNSPQTSQKLRGEWPQRDHIHTNTIFGVSRLIRMWTWLIYVCAAASSPYVNRHVYFTENNYNWSLWNHTQNHFHRLHPGCMPSPSPKFIQFIGYVFGGGLGSDSLWITIYMRTVRMSVYIAIKSRVEGGVSFLIRRPTLAVAIPSDLSPSFLLVQCLCCSLLRSPTKKETSVTKNYAFNISG